MKNPSEIYKDAITSGHSDHFRQFNCLATIHQYKPVYKIVSRYDLGDDILDWGCGNGHFSYWLVNNEIPVTGYSFDPTPKPLMDSPLFTHVPGDNPFTLPFEDGRFSTVFSIGVLEHVHETGGDPETSMKEIFRVLRPGGLFICVHLPNTNGWIEPFAKTVGLSGNYHDQKYTRKTATELFERVGLTVLETGAYNFLPRNKFRHLPKSLTNNKMFVAGINGVDAILSTLGKRWVQNIYLIARKP